MGEPGHNEGFPRPKSPANRQEAVYRFLTFLLLSFASALTIGQPAVPIPVPVPSFPDIREAESSATATIPLSPGETIVVLSTLGASYDNDSAVVCVRESLEETDPPMRLVSAKTVRESIFSQSDDLILPSRRQDWNETWNRPQVQATINELNLRYIIEIAVQQEELPGSFHYTIAGTLFEETVRLEAKIWDVAQQTFTGSLMIQTGSELKGVFFFGVAIFGFPRFGAESHACKNLAKSIVAVIAEGELPEEIHEYYRQAAVRKVQLQEEAEREVELGVERVYAAATYTLARDYGDPTYLRRLAEQGNQVAAVAMARDFGELSYLRKLAEKGNYESAFTLAQEAGELVFLKRLAEQGDYQAAYYLFSLTGNSEFLERLAEQGNERAIAELYRVAAVTTAQDRREALAKSVERGDTKTAYRMYRRNPNTVNAWRWLCAAANGLHSKAQEKVGYWHRASIWSKGQIKLLRDVGVRPDDRIAYMWYTLALTEENSSTLLDIRDNHIAKQLSNSQIVQAEQMLRDWKPGDCPSAEFRLPESRSFEQASRVRSDRKKYASVEGNAVAESLAALRIQHEKGALSDEEYMQRQRDIINEYTRKTRASLRSDVPSD
jgi:TPR repeat protein